MKYCYCRFCGKELKLRKDGRVRRHFDHLLEDNCPGSLEVPAAPSHLTKEK